MSILIIYIHLLANAYVHNNSKRGHHLHFKNIEFIPFSVVFSYDNLEQFVCPII